jgi:membrane fusion protein (multidrug efflux system)
MDAQTPDHLRDERRPEAPVEDERTPGRRDREDDERDRRSHADQRERDDRDDERDEPDKPKKSWKEILRAHPFAVAAAIVVVVLLLLGGLLWWLHARNYESTDDAFIDARITAIAPQISGTISEVDVTDNQMVEAGTLLMRIDPQIFQAQFDQAKAQVDQAKASIANLDAQIEAEQSRIFQADQQVKQASAGLEFAQEQYTRYQQLAKTGADTVQQAQQAKATLLQNQATFSSAEANAIVERKQLVVLKTQRQGADAQLEAAAAQQRLAESNLSYTTISAPVAGRVTKLTAATGAYVAPGQALSMFVPRDIWITANFKESQLALMHPGQPVAIRVDAFPDRSFNGHIDSIQAGSGTAFSLLPAENATGNYVKVVQRVPVKIVFDTPPDVELGPGMSVVPTAKVR